MINHFHTYLLNRPAEYFQDSLFPIHVSTDFEPSPWNEITRRIDRTLFGELPDASLLDYRFVQFLKVIGGCHLEDHIHRFDSRETYEEVSLHDERHFQPSIIPARGLVVTENPDRPPSFLRRRFSVLFHAERNIPLTVFLDGDRLKPARTTTLTNNSCYVEALSLTLTASQSGWWVVDYRVRPHRSLEQIIQETLELPEKVFGELFATVKETAPEYAEGFHVITDSLTKFCMILLAQAAANERMKDAWDQREKRVADQSFPSIDAEGTLYYGSSPNELLRIVDIKRELQQSPVRNRRQTVEIGIPTLGYLYLCWPVRFGLPARNRIIVDGLLNSAWTVHYISDIEEQYVLFRSHHKIRTEKPVRIEIL